MFLGALISNAYRSGKSFNWKLWAVSLLLCFGYALFDEFMQRFSPGRAFEAIDIFTDSIGGLFGIILYVVFIKLYYKIKEGKNDSFKEVKESKKSAKPIAFNQTKTVLCDVIVHLVWVTKDKRPVLVDEVALLVRAIIKEFCAKYNLAILKGNVSSDHVHIIVKLTPDICLSTFMNRMLGKMNRIILFERRMLDHKTFGRQMWHHGYFAGSTGQVDDSVIETYIDSPEHLDLNSDEVFTIK